MASAIPDRDDSLRCGARALDGYIRRGIWDIHGWLNAISADLIAQISRIQLDQGLKGSIGEIGVHHGKLFVLLMLASSRTERLFAVDVFEEQDKNVDRSGKGDRQIFERNIARYGVSPEEVQIMQASSLELTSADIAQRFPPIRLCSIDGGHTAQCASHDFALLGAHLMPGGAIILDDFFNQSWPGVMSGLVDALHRPGASLVPFIVTVNKVFVADRESAKLYRQLMRRAAGHYFDKTDSLLGHEIDIYGIDCKQPKPPFAERLRKTYRLWR